MISTIRKYEQNDFDEVAKVYLDSKADEFKGEDFSVTVTPLKEDEEQMRLFQKSEIFVYEEDAILGFVGYIGDYISWLFVAPGARRRGIAKSLILHVLPKIENKATLTVAKSNVAAVNLYRKLGFHCAKESVGQFQGNELVIIQMVLERDYG